VGLTLRPEYYRRNALELLRLANTASDPRSKAMLIDMVVAWRRLAEHVESIRHRPYAHHHVANGASAEGLPAKFKGRAEN